LLFLFDGNYSNLFAVLILLISILIVRFYTARVLYCLKIQFLISIKIQLLKNTIPDKHSDFMGL